MLVRCAQQSDIANLLELADELHRLSSFSRIPLNAEKVARYFARCIEREGRMLLIASNNERPLGYLSGAVYDYMFSDDLFATEEHWYVRDGCSRAAIKLMNSFIDWAGTFPIREINISIGTGVRLEQTDRLLKKYGFTNVGGNYKREA